MASDHSALIAGPSVRLLLLPLLLLALLPLLRLTWAIPVVVDSRTVAASINPTTASNHYQRQHHHHHHQPAATAIADSDEESFNGGAALERAEANQPRIGRSSSIPVKKAVIQHEQEEEVEEDEDDDDKSIFGSALPIAEKLVLEQHQPAAQKLYPAFFRNIPPLGHSRPYYQPPVDPALIEQQQQQQQQPRYTNKIRQNAVPGGGAVVVPVPEAVTAAAPLPALLGSGDFGVIKGGTFYYDNDVPGKGGGNIFLDEFYRLGYSGGNNGHGRPQLGYLLQAAKGSGAGSPKEEQFSNFRDFADINISNDPAYSNQAPQYAQLAADYHPHQHHEPDNILDELRTLDQQPVQSKRQPKDGGNGASSQQGSSSTCSDGGTTSMDDYMLASS
ncbi:uncharacterized protein LOC118458719 [Anopheles albimanus]|uniref:Uncharacterized protein n=1 Tax=Anopheles albimanus TaxID=7167 RepID=A0A182F9W0_ANOAL|nr:uncharacterized protein LOC118458719 [Anopheles albimanus]